MIFIPLRDLSTSEDASSHLSSSHLCRGAFLLIPGETQALRHSFPQLLPSTDMSSFIPILTSFPASLPGQPWSTRHVAHLKHTHLSPPTLHCSLLHLQHQKENHRHPSHRPSGHRLHGTWETCSNLLASQGFLLLLWQPETFSKTLFSETPDSGQSAPLSLRDICTPKPSLSSHMKRKI